MKHKKNKTFLRVKNLFFKATSILLSTIFLFTIDNHQVFSQKSEELLLKNYRPNSIFVMPKTFIHKARFQAIDIHSHDYASSYTEIAQWVKNMDDCGIEKTIILSSATGDKFDSIFYKYNKFGNRFEIWCGIDYTDYDKPNFGSGALKELERCFRMGAKGVGEEGDKGLGLYYDEPQKAWGMHFDDPRMKPIFEKCAELKMPVNIHVADPKWMYEKMDSTNDGLMNAMDWRIDMTNPGTLGFDALILTLENAVKNNPKTTFIACHYANLNHDIDKLGTLLDKYPNLYTDISSRFAESATIPRKMRQFFEKHQNRILFGTDLGYDKSMYRICFRILESEDEHFYDFDKFNYHWALNGFGLSTKVLRKIYHDNALKIYK